MKLQFRKPYKITSVQLNKEYLNSIDAEHYERGCAVLTPRGIVMTSQCKWRTNSGLDSFTYFTTIINGIHYSAFLEASQLSDRQLKYKTTQFLNGIKIN